MNAGAGRPSAVKEMKWCGKCWVIRPLGIGCSPDPETEYDKAAERGSHTLTKVEQAFSLLSVEHANCPAGVVLLRQRGGSSLEKLALVD